MHGPLLGSNATHISHPASAIFLGVAVEQLSPVTTTGNSYLVSETRHRRDIEHSEDSVFFDASLPEKRDGAGRTVITVHPLESGNIVLKFVQGGFASVGSIQLFHPARDSAVESISENVPIQATVVRPFMELCDFSSHE